jgi:chromosome segregation ATPase
MFDKIVEAGEQHGEYEISLSCYELDEKAEIRDLLAQTPNEIKCELHDDLDVIGLTLQFVESEQDIFQAVNSAINAKQSGSIVIEIHISNSSPKKEQSSRLCIIDTSSHGSIALRQVCNKVLNESPEEELYEHSTSAVLYSRTCNNVSTFLLEHCAPTISTVQETTLPGLIFCESLKDMIVGVSPNVEIKSVEQPVEGKQPITPKVKFQNEKQLVKSDGQNAEYVASLEGQIVQLEAQYDDKSRKYAQLTAQHNELLRSSKEQIRDEHKKYVTQLENEKVHFGNQVVALKREFGIATAKLESQLKSEKQITDREAERLNGIIKELRETIDQRYVEISELTKRLAAKDKALKDLVHEKDTKISSLQDRLDRAMQEAEAQAKRLREELDMTKEVLSSTTNVNSAQLQKLVTDNAQLVQQVQQLQSESNTGQSSLKEQLANSIRESTSQIDKLKKELAASEDTRKKNEERSTHLKNLVDVANAKLNGANQSVSTLQKQLDTMAQESSSNLRKLQEELKQEKVLLSSAEQKLETLTNENVQFNNKFKHLNATLTTLTQEKVQLQAQLDSLTKDSNVEVLKLRKDLEQAKGQLANAETTSKEQLQANERLKNQVDQLQEQLATMIRTAEQQRRSSIGVEQTLTIQKVQLEITIQKLNEDLQDMRKERDTLKSRIENVESELNQVRELLIQTDDTNAKEVKKLLDENDQLKSQVEQVQQALVQSDKEHVEQKQTLQEANNQTRKELETTVDNYRQLVGENKRHVAQIEQLNTSLAEERQSLQSQLESISKLLDENARLEQELKKIAVLTDENQKLEKKLEILKHDSTHQVQSLQDELEQTKQLVENTESTNAQKAQELVMENSRLKTQLEQVRENLTEMMQMSNMERIEYDAREQERIAMLSRLDEELEQTRRALSELQLSYGTLERENEHLKYKLEQMNENVTSMLREHNKERMTLQDQIDNFIQHVTTLSTSLEESKQNLVDTEQMNATQTQALLEENENLKDQIEQLETNAKGIELDRNAKNQELEYETSKVAKLQNELQQTLQVAHGLRVENEKFAYEIDRLQEDVKDLKVVQESNLALINTRVENEKVIETMAKELQLANLKLASLEQERAMLYDKLAALETILKDLRVENEAVVKELRVEQDRATMQELTHEDAIKALHLKLKLLEAEHETEKNRSSALSDQVASLEHTNEELRHAVGHSGNTLSALHNDIEEKQRHIHALESTNDTLTKEYERVKQDLLHQADILQKEVDHLRNANLEKQNHISDVTKLLTEQYDRVHEMTNELKAKEERIEELHSNLVQDSAINKELIDELEYKSNKLSKDLETVIHERDALESRLISESEKLVAQLEQVVISRDGHEQHAKKLQSELESVSEQLKQVRASKDEQSRVHAQEISTLQYKHIKQQTDTAKELDQYRTRVKEVEQQLQQLRAERDSLAQRLRSAELLRDASMKQVTDLQSKLIELEVSTQSYAKQIQELEQLFEEQNSKFGELERERDELGKTLIEVEQERVDSHASASSELAHARIEVESLSNENKKLQVQLLVLQEQSAMIKELEETLEQVQNEKEEDVKHLESQLREKSLEYDAIVTQLKTAQLDLQAHITELEKQCKELDEDYVALQNKSEQEKNEQRKSYESRIDALSIELKDRCNQIENKLAVQLRIHVEKLKGRDAELKTAREEHEVVVQNLQAQVASMKSKCISLETQLAELNDELVKKQSQLEIARQNRSLNDDEEIDESEYEDYDGWVSDQPRITEAKKALEKEDLTRRRDAIKHPVQNSLREELEKVRKQVTQLAHENETLTNQISAQSKLIEEMEDMKDELEDQVEALEDEKQVLDEELKKIQINVAELSNALQRHLKDLDRIQKERRELELEKNSLKRQLDQKTREEIEMGMNVNHLHSKRNQLQDELKQEEMKQDGTKRVQYQQIQERLAQLEKTVSQKEAELEKAKQEREKLKNQYEALEARSIALEKQLISRIDAIKEMHDLKLEMGKKQIENEQLIEAVANQSGTVSDLYSSNSALQVQVDNLREELKERIRQCELLQQATQEDDAFTRDKFNKLKEENSTLIQTVSQQSDTLGKLYKQQTALEKQLKEMRTKADHIEQVYQINEALKDENTQFSDRLVKCQAQVEQLQNKLKEENKRFIKEQEDIEDRVKSMLNDDDAIPKLREELARATEERETLERIIRERDDEIVELKVALQQMEGYDMREYTSEPMMELESQLMQMKSLNKKLIGDIDELQTEVVELESMIPTDQLMRRLERKRKLQGRDLTVNAPISPRKSPKTPVGFNSSMDLKRIPSPQKSPRNKEPKTVDQLIKKLKYHRDL